MLNRFFNRTTESLVKHRTLKDFALSLGSSIDKTIMDETNKVLIEEIAKVKSHERICSA